MEPPRHSVAVVALSGHQYRRSKVTDKAWDGPSLVLDEDLDGAQVQWMELDAPLEGPFEDPAVQGEFISSSIELECLVTALVPADVSQVIMIRGSSSSAAAVATLLVTNLLLFRGATAGAFFLYYVAVWGAELGIAINIASPSRRSSGCLGLGSEPAR